MKIITLVLIIPVLWIVACSEKSDKKSTDIEAEILELKTGNDKKQYLAQILEDDQKVRGSEGQQLMLKYGKDSKEYLDYVRAQWQQDEVNLLKVEKYLEVYGYPTKEMGEQATTTPWLIIHHAQEYDARERNFEQVYQAYLMGAIDYNAISFYLGRMYEMKNGERLKMESPYQPEEEINQLIKVLNLEEKKARAQQALETSKNSKP